MDLWQLYVFCKVVELGSFSKAGLQIHLTQPTVSTHIKDLESHFGCRLIDRLSKQAVPTKSGELLYEYAKKLLALKEETETAMAQFQGLVKGKLIIGGSTIPGVYILPKIIGAYVKEYPLVSVCLKMGDTEEIVKQIISGDIELGIVGALIDDSRIFQEKYVEDEMCLVIPSDHKWKDKTQVTLNMLKSEPFIIRESGSGTLRSFQESLENAGMHMDDLKIVAEMGSTASVIQAIKNHIGISIVSSIAISEDVKAGKLKELKVKGLKLKRNFFLTHSKYRSKSPICIAFTDFLMRYK